MSNAINVGGAPASIEQDFAEPASPWSPAYWGGPSSILFAAGPAVVEGSATLGGAAALVAAALLIIPASASPAGTGALSASATVQVLAAAAPAGAGSLAGSAYVLELAGAALAGSSELAAEGEVIGSGPPPPPTVPPPHVPFAGGANLPPLPPLPPAPVVVTGRAELVGTSDLVAEAEVEPGPLFQELLALL